MTAAMDEQRVRQIVREELAEAVPVIQDRVRSCLASDLARPNKLRRRAGFKSSPLDRNLQFEVLCVLRKVYPDSLNTNELPNRDHPGFRVNLCYLAERGLIEDTALAHPMAIHAPRITAEGLDFIEGVA